MDDDNSSDEMIEIQVEDSLVRESLMLIDSANFKEYITVISAFSIMLMFFLILGIFGISNNHSQINSVANFSCIELPQINRLNRFIDIYLHYRHENSSKYESLATEVSLFTKTSDPKYSHTINVPVNITAYESKTSTEWIKIYSLRIINFEGLFINITLPEQDIFDEPEIRIETQNYVYAVVIIILASLFILANLGLCILYIIKINYWHIEQIITVILFISNLLADIPLNLVSDQSIIHLIFNSISVIYLRLVFLILFDSLRYKNRRISNCFFTPKLILSIVSLTVSILETITNSFTYIKIISWACTLLFYLYITTSIILASVQVDITERYKFNLYIIILIEFVVFIGSAYSFSEFGSTKQIVPYSLRNIIGFLFAYFHYPFEDINTYQ